MLDNHKEKDIVRHRLRTVGDAACTSQRIAMIEFARAAAMFGQSWRVDRVAILDYGACRTAAIRHIVLCARAVYLLRPQIVAIVGERVAGSSRIRNADDAVLDVVSQRRDTRSHRNGRTVPVQVITVSFGTCCREFIMMVIRIRCRRGASLFFEEDLAAIIKEVGGGASRCAADTPSCRIVSETHDIAALRDDRVYFSFIILSDV